MTDQTDQTALRARIAATMREHYLCTDRAEADADGNLPCRCGDWREPGAEVDDENDWDSHLADAVLSVLPTPTDRATTLREREQRQRPNTPPSRPDASPIAAPVKQRADCTELEWAVQERARFERLYTRETVRADLAEQRADTAARDADIYQQRLERLGEGYTEQRKRAEKAEADANHNADLVADAVQRAEQAEVEAERLRTDRAAEFTAADLVAALRSAGAEKDKLHAKETAQLRAVVARLRQMADYWEQQLPDVIRTPAVVAAIRAALEAADDPSRMADEAQQPEAQAAVTVQHAPGIAILCPDCRAKGHSVCMDGEGAAVTVRAVPLPGSNGISACCGRPPCEFVGEGVTRDPAAVTCPGPAVGAQQPEAHSCPNCEGVDPDTCLTNPDRPAAVQQPKEARP